MGRRASRRRWPVVAGVALVTMGIANMAASETATEDEIRTLDAQEAVAMGAADLPALEALWSAGLVVNAPDGTVKGREQVLQAVREGRIRYAAFDRTVERVVLHDDWAISMGGEVVVPVGDRPDAGRKTPRRYSHLWRTTGGVWRLVARHANVSPPRE